MSAYPVPACDAPHRSPLTYSTTSIVDSGIALGWDAPSGNADISTCSNLWRRIPEKVDGILSFQLADPASITINYIHATSHQESVRDSHRVNPLSGNGKSGQSNFAYVDPTLNVLPDRAAVYACVGEIVRDEATTAPSSSKKGPNSPVPSSRTASETDTFKEQPTPFVPAGQLLTCRTIATLAYITIPRLCRPRGHPRSADANPTLPESALPTDTARKTANPTFQHQQPPAIRGLNGGDSNGIQAINRLRP